MPLHQAKLPKWNFDPDDLNNIKLHRVWTHANVEDVHVFKFPRETRWRRVVSRARVCPALFSKNLQGNPVGELALGNGLMQLAIKSELSMLSLYRRQLLLVSTFIDPGSNTQKSLTNRASRVHRKIRNHSHHVFGTFDVNHGLGIQKIAKSVLTGTCLVLTLPMTSAMRTLSQFVQNREDVGFSDSI